MSDLSTERFDHWERPAGTDLVNHPPHYEGTVPGIECIEVVQHFAFCRGNAIKYLWRAGAKEGSDEVQDLRKAIWYIEREIAMIEAQAAHGA